MDGGRTHQPTAYHRDGHAPLKVQLVGFGDKVERSYFVLLHVLSVYWITVPATFQLAFHLRQHIAQTLHAALRDGDTSGADEL